MTDPVTEAEQLIASREKPRHNTQIDFRGTQALELIADELTRLRAEVTALRYLLEKKTP